MPKILRVVAVACVTIGASIVPVPEASALYVTELLASNDTGLADEDGDRDDWLEIHNEAGVPVDIGGYYPTDDEDTPTKWQFPSLSIPAGGYLLVWASNEDRTNTALPLHTNFVLLAGGEYLALIAPDGATVVHEYAPEFPAQVADRSYGLASDLMTERCFVNPTPGAPNDESAPYSEVAAVDLNVPHGFYDAPFELAPSTTRSMPARSVTTSSRSRRCRS